MQRPDILAPGLIREKLLREKRNGVPDCVPPNALLRCEVELLEVWDSAVPRPEDYPSGQQLFVFLPGEAARGLPRWQFQLEEDGHCGAWTSFPIPGMRWRYTRHRAVSMQMDRAASTALFQEAITLPRQYPAECLTNEQLWADSTDPANSITRDRQTNSLPGPKAGRSPVRGGALSSRTFAIHSAGSGYSSRNVLNTQTS
jgi:hypothetical protein